MKIKFVVAMCFTVSLFLSSCCTKCVNIPPTENGTPFVLTISLDKNRTELQQTIFIESPSDNSGNTFALAARFDYDSFDSVNYKNVTIKNMILRRLTGDSFKIMNVETAMGKSLRTDNASALIKVTVEKIRDPDNNNKDEFVYKGEIDPIENLSVSQTIQTDISFVGKILWRPRICEGYIASGSGK